MSRQPIIELNDPDLEGNTYDFHIGLNYKGQPFSGTVKDGKDLTEFENGNAHGKSIEHHENGQLHSETIFQNGQIVKEICWYQDGKIQEISSSDESISYSREGNIAFQVKDGISCSFYKNGRIKEKQELAKGVSYYYSSKGNQVAWVRRKDEINYMELDINEFQHAVFELIESEYPEFDNQITYDHFPRYLIQFCVLITISKHPSIGLKILSKLKESPDKRIRDMAEIISEHQIDFELHKTQSNEWGYAGFKLQE